MKHKCMSLFFAICIIASLASPVTGFSAEETPVSEQQIENESSESATDADDKIEEGQDNVLTEEEQEDVKEEIVSEKEESLTDGNEETVRNEVTGENSAELSEDKSGIPEGENAAPIEEGNAESEKKQDVIVDPLKEEVVETAVEALRGSWDGPGIYEFYDTKNGKTLGIRYLYSNNDNNYHKGFKTVDGYPYYFDPKTGYMKVGWFTVNGYKYYGNTASKFENGRGILYSGLKTIGGHHYYFFGSTKDGHYGKTMAKKTWVTTGGQKFYAGKDGKLICGFKTIGGKGYYFYPSGNSSHKYGQMAKGWFTYNGFKYYANPSSGVLTTGFKTIDGVHYYFYPKTSGKHYAKTMAKGWFTVNGFKYYADSSGNLVTGWNTIGGKKYYFWPTTANGHYSRTMARNGTYTINGIKYTFNKDGLSTSVIDVAPYFENGDIYGFAEAAGLPYNYEYNAVVIDTNGMNYYRDYSYQYMNNTNKRYTFYGITIGDSESTVKSKMAATGKFSTPYVKNNSSTKELEFFFNNMWHNGYFSSEVICTFKNGKLTKWSIAINGGE